MNDLVIVGAGGFGREIVNVVDDDPLGAVEHRRIRLVGFLDDGEPDLDLLERIDVPFLGDTSNYPSGAGYVIGIGDGALRQSVADRLTGDPFRALIHSSASIGRDVEIADGSVICAGVVITTNVQAGVHLHVNLMSTIGHDCRIGDFVTISPGVNISGNVTIGDGAYFGTNAAVLPGVTVGARAVVGAGALVRRDVAPGERVAGVPARPI